MVKVTNKKSSSKSKTETDGDTIEKKTPGRKTGQKIEKEPVIIIPLNSKYRIKIDKYGKILQEKGEPKETEQVTKENSEDKGWKNPKYFNTWEQLIKYFINELTRQKAKKEETMTFENYLELFNKTTKEVKKMFAPLDEVKVK